ncbi:MAG: hypothetical protein LUG18_15505 [Candidatus Azobacteroides sp.]|nr:hypothetical protein [Candidatus Azobacteroides sp.]
MKRKITLLSLLLITFSGWAQQVTILEQREIPEPEEQEEFYYIPGEFAPVAEAWIGKLQSTCTHTKNATLEDIFLSLWETANLLGANAFFIEEYTHAQGNTSVTIAIFYLEEEEVEEMYEFYPTNTIYIFGELKADAKKKGVKVNKEKVEIEPLKYYAYQQPLNEKATVSVGGMFGTKYIRKGEEGQPSVFLTLGGFSAAPAVGGGGSIGVNFSTGSIFPFSDNFGMFLIEILEEE